MKKIGFIGCGNMGGALAVAVGKKAAVLLYDKDSERAELLAKKIPGAVTADLDTLTCECDFLFLGVKPNIIPSVILDIKEKVKKSKSLCIVSMAAGISTNTLESLFESSDVPVIRIMPNTPVAIGKGMILVCENSSVSSDAREVFADIMEYAGRLDYIPEELIDAGCALSGCGPAFVYMYIDALAKGAEKCGLPREKALIYAAQTALGASEMILASSESPDELTRRVCSPGGSTIEGVHSLEADSLEQIACRAVRASYDKTLILGSAQNKESKKG